MKNNFFFIALFIICIASNIPAYTQIKDNDKSLLWKVSGKDLTVPSYVFGTIHRICLNDFLWTDAMKNSLRNCKTMCFEMDMSNPTILTEVGFAMMNNSGKQFKDYFNENEYKIISTYCKDSLGIDVSLLKRIKPIALLGFILTKSPACSYNVAYEDTILKMGKLDDKKTIGLETPAEQIKVLENIPLDTLKKELLQHICHPSISDSFYNTMVDAYKNQDLPLLHQQTVLLDNMGEISAAFIKERNKKWVPILLKNMKEGSLFVAVGAGHLYGESGLIGLLRNEGYLVEAVR